MLTDIDPVLWLVALSVFCSVVWSVFCISVGFWMGRTTQGPGSDIAGLIKDLVASVRGKSAPLLDEDPYYEPMYGERQARVSTVLEEDND